MKPYPEYKPTGLAWLPQVPSGWKVCRLTFRYSVQLGKMLDSQKITGEFLVPYVRNQDVQWDHVNLDDLPLMDIKPEERERFCARHGDLLVCEGGEIGRTAILSASDKVFFQKAIMRLRVQDEEQDFPRFMFYVMYTASAYGAFSAATGKSTIAHLPAEKLSASRFAFPPPAEQRAIVAYLDQETAKIDRLIQLKERMVELLNEKRGAIISSVVTGKVEVEKVGGGVSLRVSVPPCENSADGGKCHTESRSHGEVRPRRPDELVDSGDVFVKEIPSSWKCQPVRQLFEISRGRVIAASAVSDHGYPVYSSQTKEDGLLGYIDTYDFDCEQLTWTTDGANAGTVFLRRGKYNCTNVCGMLKPKSSEHDIKYLYYALGYFAVFHKRADTNGYKIMSNEMAAIKIPLPPLPEQREIVAYLDAVTAKIDAAVKAIEKSIGLLKERRVRLVSDAVTGRIDLREEVAA